MDQTLGEEKVGIWGEDVGLRSCKKGGGRWRDPRDSHWPCESLGALCKLQLFPGVWRYGQALLPHGSLVPGGLRPMQGVAGGPRARSRCPSSSPFCAPLRGAGGGGKAPSGLCERSPRARAASLSGRGISHKVLCEPVKKGPKAGPTRAERSAK